MTQAVETVKGWTLASHTVVVLVVVLAVTVLAFYHRISSDSTVGVYVAALGFARGTTHTERTEKNG